MEKRKMRYDIAVIGNDEAALEMAAVAARAGQSIIAVLPESRHSTWMMSQALRRLVSDLLVDHSEIRQKRMHASATPRMLKRLITHAIVSETNDQISKLERLGVNVLLGETRIQSARELLISNGVNASRQSVQAQNIVIGTGVRQTAVHRPLGLVPFHRPESLFEGMSLTSTLTIIGGQDLGAGIAALFSLFGVATRLLMTENDTTSAISELAVDAGVHIAANNFDDAPGSDIFSRSSNDVVDCRRSIGFTENLNLQALGIEPDEHGQLWCTDSLETWCTGVFGIGSVVGFTSAAPTTPTRQAGHILNHITHRIPRPHFLRIRNRMFDYA